MLSIDEAIGKTEYSKEQIMFVSETDNEYFVRHFPEDKYDHVMYRINKESGEVTLFDIILYISEPIDAFGHTAEDIANVIFNKRENAE